LLLTGLASRAQGTVEKFITYRQAARLLHYLALRSSIPALTRSTLHRCLQRQGVSRLPRAPRPRRGQFAAYEIGYFHLDIAEVRTAREKAYLYVAVDRTSKLAFARIYRRATALVSAAFLKVLAKAIAYPHPHGADG
jgi:transposase-like protein